jgi:hypothetical protein
VAARYSLCAVVGLTMEMVTVLVLSAMVLTAMMLMKTMASNFCHGLPATQLQSKSPLLYEYACT